MAEKVRRAAARSTVRCLAALLLGVGLLSAAPRPAQAGLGAGVTAGYFHIDFGQDTSTYQVGPMLDYWADGSNLGWGLKALFSTYDFDFSQRVTFDDAQLDAQFPNVRVSENDDVFRVDVDAALRYLLNDWLVLVGGFRYEKQSIDANIDITGLEGLPIDLSVLEDAFSQSFDFDLYALALAATAFTRPMDGGPTVFLTFTLFPFAYVDLDLKVPGLDEQGNFITTKADDLTDFGGFAIEGGADQPIPGLDGASVGLSIRYQQMTVFEGDDEQLLSVLPYVHYSF